jgi:hypothetical protein
LSDSSLVRRDFAMMVAGALALLAIVGVSVWLVARTNEHSGEVARALELRTSTARLPARCLRTSLNYDVRNAGGTRGAGVRRLGGHLRPAAAVDREAPGLEGAVDFGEPGGPQPGELVLERGAAIVGHAGLGGCKLGLA